MLFPWGGVNSRFYARNGDKRVSVYFDRIDMLGCVGAPYWEVSVRHGDCERFYEGEEEEMMRFIGACLGNE